ncbi:MAG: biotin--[acetyl-CoA-carboxylase] ligase [Chitinivibrionales bacterium]|nr:biotin--[acetyl-CoA-carboxylase] ligase [Chitinivibrionales bacterium]MBD3357087.1 biotin--[acetyl-CoA-carboxylase] ligase [Chitinivibrionales bacterium]
MHSHNSIYAVETLDFVERCWFFNETDSTNTQAATLCPSSPTGLHVFWALRQTKGRGRHGRDFFSDVDGGLWASIAVPMNDVGKHFIINRALCLALCRAIRSVAPNAPVAIKWPNDIYWGHGKICGILLENPGRTPPILIVGFGLNVNIRRTQFPEELQTIATSLTTETGSTYDLLSLLVHILTEYHGIHTMDQDNAHAEYLDLLYGVGRLAATDRIGGIVETVEPDGRLVLRNGNKRRYVFSGTLRFVD